MASALLFLLCVFYVFDPSVGLKCYSGYNIEFTDQKAESSVDCPTGACMRMQGSFSTQIAVSTVTSTVVYLACRPVSDCATETCESIKESLRAPLQAQSINVDDVEQKQCTIACCNNADDCNNADVKFMEPLKTTLAKTTTPAGATTDKFTGTGTMETAVHVTGSSNVTMEVNTKQEVSTQVEIRITDSPSNPTTSSSLIHCASATFLLAALVATSIFI